jgi:hypothetical protein
MPYQSGGGERRLYGRMEGTTPKALRLGDVVVEPVHERPRLAGNAAVNVAALWKHRINGSTDANMPAACQSARKRDPESACKKDPGGAGCAGSP